MIVEQISAHPDIPGVDREVAVLRIDNINFIEAKATMFIEIRHKLNGKPHPYLGNFVGVMESTNQKFVNGSGAVVDADSVGAIPEFAWLMGAIQQGANLFTLIRALIHRNAARGNFDTDDWRE